MKYIILLLPIPQSRNHPESYKLGEGRITLIVARPKLTVYMGHHCKTVVLEKDSKILSFNTLSIL